MVCFLWILLFSYYIKKPDPSQRIGFILIACCAAGLCAVRTVCTSSTVG